MLGLGLEIRCTLEDGNQYQLYEFWDKKFNYDLMIRFMIERIKYVNNKDIDYSKNIILVIHEDNSVGYYKDYGEDYKKWNINTIKAKLMNLWLKLW